MTGDEQTPEFEADADEDTRRIIREPVGPVTRMIPYVRWIRFSNCSRVLGMMPRRWRPMLIALLSRTRRTHLVRIQYSFRYPEEGGKWAEYLKELQRIARERAGR